MDHTSTQGEGKGLVRGLSHDAGGSQNVPLHNGISDQALVFFLVTVGFFFVSLIWHLYIRFGWDRDGARQIDKQATAAMEMTGLPSDGGNRTERKRKLRGAGGWLSAA